MACAEQTAVEFVRRGRIRLVSGLKGLSVILENLLDKRIFNPEMVSKIQAEIDDYDKRRKILDFVTNMGEKASEIFLKLLHDTRKRTLSPDLHPWISWYSFEEDTQMDIHYELEGPKTCHQYQEKLKSKAQKISNEFWKANERLFEKTNKPELSYTPLVLDTQQSVSPSKIKKIKSRKSKISRHKKLKTYFNEDRTENSPSVLLEDDKDIFLVGKAGIGKTALSLEILKLWAQRHNKKLDYMFYFDMRETRIKEAKSLEDLLFGLFSEPDEGKEEVLQDIKKNSDNVTIIFDGITELSPTVVQGVVNKDLLPDAKVIVTCRPDDEDLPPSNFLRVEVKGFSEQSIRTYISSKLVDEQKTKVLSNLELLTLCHVPVYALMVVVCLSSDAGFSPQPCSLTEIYINIVRFCLQRNSRVKTSSLNPTIKSKRNEILSLAEAAFQATEGKTVTLTNLLCEDSCVLSFLNPLVLKVAHTETITMYAFLHYTMQEFFAALWLLHRPEKITDVFRQCQTEEKKHMRHIIPFTCRLLSEKNPSLMTCLIPAQELKSTSILFFKEMLNAFDSSDEADPETSRVDLDGLFLCQCLFESQCPETCLRFLDKLNYELDLSDVTLDPYSCCAVAYVVTQSREKKIALNLEDAVVSDQGMRQLLACLQHVHWQDPLPQQLWKTFVLCEEQVAHIRLLQLDGNRLHLPVEGKRRLFERAVKVMQKFPEKVDVCLHWDKATSDCQLLCDSILEALPCIKSLSFRISNRGHALQDQEQMKRKEKQLFLDLCLGVADHKGERFHNVLNTLYSLSSVTIDINDMLDFCQHVKSKGRLDVFPILKPLFQSAAPKVWTIDLSERKSSILLELLKLQSEKQQVKLTGCSHEESEVRSFLQCLPHISQLSFPCRFEGDVEFLGDLFCAAAEREQQTGEKMLELLSSVCSYQTFPFLHDGYDYEHQSDFLLDLYSHLKHRQTQTGLSLLPSLQSILQSAAPKVWTIKLSERKSSILLELLKLQSEKQQVELTDCSHEESEVRSFLQCLPHISQLSFYDRFEGDVEFLGDLFCAAAEREQQTGEKMLELLSSVFSYQTFPFLHDGYDYDDDDNDEYQSDFLLDLYSHLKHRQTQTGLSLLPSLQSILQSAAPKVWTIKLSERKSSILLELLKLQSEKQQVELTDCSHEESEVRSFLQCLPHISQLRFYDRFEGKVEFLGDLICAAAEREQQTGEKMLELLSSVCSYQTLPLRDNDFLLDLYSHLKHRQTQTGLSLLPSLQSILQSAAPKVWTIKLSERKSSILLELLKLQSEKQQVKLTGCSHEESEVRSFLQCLPHISQLRFYYRFKGDVEFLGDLFCAAAEREQQTGEKMLELLSSVCSYQTFPLRDGDFLLDLYSHLKHRQTQTGLSLLPSLQSILQSAAPKVWTIKLSERKSSILLELLKLQSEKQQVALTGCSHEESEVRSFLQCLPHISQLSFPCRFEGDVEFLGDLFCAAAEREQQTGEKMLELLSSVFSYQTFPFLHDGYDYEHQSDFLLDLYSHLKHRQTQTGLSLLPSLQSILQSAAPKVWTIKLSERKSSILLELLKLQSEKQQVELTDCSHEESEVRSFLQCLPHISQLSFYYRFKGKVEFLGDLFCAAAEREQQTGEKMLELLSSVCSYQTFPLRDGDFLLDLYSHLKHRQTQTGLSLLPSLQSILQSAAPKVWTIKLSERKSSILLELLKLQSEKQQVALTGCSHEESEVRSFLQCLPHISQLSFPFMCKGDVEFLGDLFCAAAEREQQTGEKMLELLSSVCSYQTFPFLHDDDNDKYQSDFLLDLYSHLKHRQTQTGLSLLPSLQSILQSAAPKVWTIKLSERKSSILLELLKLQSEKQQVKLTDCSHEESEVRSFLQCLPHISQLSFYFRFKGKVEFLGDLFCAAAEREQQTGEKMLELLSSVCSYQTLPLRDGDFLLDLYSHLKHRQTQTGLSLLPSLQSILQSAAPKVWTIKLSERKSSILLELLKLQSEKQQVELTGCSHEESEVRSFLQCLPHISQLSFYYRFEGKVEFLGDLFCAAAEREQQTGEKMLELLSSVCSYQMLPLRDNDFLLDLYSHLKHRQTQTGLSLLPSLQSILQSAAPKVWTIKLSERKSSILLELLKLQSEKQQVKLTGCSHEESEVRSFLQCLPHISQLSFYFRFEGDVEYLGDLFCAAAEREQQTGEKMLELLSSVCSYQTFPFLHDDDEHQSDFLLDLYSHLKHRQTQTGLSLLPSSQSFLQSAAPQVWTIKLSERKSSILLELLKLQSEKQQVELTGCSHEESEVRSFLQCLPHISQLRLSIDMVLLLFRWVSRGAATSPVAIEELSLAPQTPQPSQRVLLEVFSSLASLLRHWAVRRLDLVDVSVPPEVLIPPLLHSDPLKIKLSEKVFQQLLSLLYETQDRDLTRSFLRKVDGDLSSSCLNWEHLDFVLQHSSAQIITVNMRKNGFLEERVTLLLPFLDRILFKRASPSFVLTAIREIHKARASPIVPSLLKSLDHVINLTCRVMEPVDCAALCFTLTHGHGVKLNLLWTSLPTGEVKSFLPMLDKVSQLSVDRNLLLRFVHCCADSDTQQEAAVGLLRTLQHKLDLSFSSHVELTEESKSETLRLTGGDCRAVSTVLRHSSRDTQLNLQDCELEDSGLELLFPVLDRVCIRASKAVLLQLLSLLPVRRAVSLCKALGRELDLSHTALDQKACRALARMLDFTDGMTELDLSHCELSDQLLLIFIKYMHKVQTVDLSHNKITDASTDQLLQLVSDNPSIDTVRLFGNNIVDMNPFKGKKFEIW